MYKGSMDEANSGGRIQYWGEGGCLGETDGGGEVGTTVGEQQ